MDEATSAAETSATRTRSDGKKRGQHDYRWVVGIWVVVALFGAITLLRSWHLDIPMRDPGGRMFSGRLTTALWMIAVLALIEAAVRARRLGSWSPRAIAVALRQKWGVERIALAVTGLIAYHLVYVCYRNLKSWDSFNQPRDDDLLAFDRWLFFGHSPWVLLHDLLGVDAAAPVLAFVYRSFTYLVPFSLLAALVFTRRIRDGYVFLASAIWVWILGVGAYYLIPSLGPFATSAADFQDLRRTAITGSQEKYLVERAHLLADPSAGDAFASISAFASLHVGFTCMIFFMLRYYGMRRASYVMAGYLGATMVATIYFGWHFVSDDVAGVVLAALAVLLGRLMIYPNGRPRDDGADLAPAQSMRAAGTDPVST